MRPPVFGAVPPAVNMKGSGTVNLSKLAIGSASVDIGGMSTLVLAPRKGANLKVRNYASAVLLSKPTELTSSLEDSGRVVSAVQ